MITFDPHPRIALGNRVELLTTLERRLELLEEAGVETTCSSPRSLRSSSGSRRRSSPSATSRAIGVEVVVAGEDFRFGVRRSGDLALLERLGFEVVVAPEVRRRLVDRDPRGARRGRRRRRPPRCSGRPFELDGIVVAGDQRGGTLGYPTANLRLEPDLACPRYGIYAGSALGHRAAVSIGTNPHYGGTERRIEPYLLDFDGDLYGKRLVVELWERLRDEAVFESEEALVAQIARDVEATRAARRPQAVDRVHLAFRVVAASRTDSR